MWLIGLIAGAYTIYGGLKAVVWTDLFQGGALLIGGAIVMVLGFDAVGGVESFFLANGDKLHLNGNYVAFPGGIRFQGSHCLGSDRGDLRI